MVEWKKIRMADARIMEFIGHKRDDGTTQLLIEHLHNVSMLAGVFAHAFGERELGEQAGLYHDIGKYSVGFQNRIMNDGSKVDHSTAGAREMFKVKNPVLAFCIAGHHSGLPDMGSKMASTAFDGTLLGRCCKKKLIGDIDYSAYTTELSKPLIFDFCKKDKMVNSFSLSFLVRMLFSSLVDADFLDTENFMSCGEISRGYEITMHDLCDRFEKYSQGFMNTNSPINTKRQEIREECVLKAEEKPGLFSLTVPTGGGKTLSSLAFALHHAAKYGKQRIIYVIPYTSIIEQTADIFRGILGDDNVIEHHMNVDYGDEEDGKENFKKLATENWDAPVIVTTNVQFFESLYANKVSRCRKIHNIVNSVVIFDEAQMLPVDYLKPCVEAIKELTKNYGVTAVLCTATQPSLNELAKPCVIKEICSDTKGLYNFFRRVRYKKLQLNSLNILADRLNKYEQVLCITNSKKDTQELYKLLQGEGCYHLSTFMYPNHRRQVLGEIRERLKHGLSCKVVSTSLIEAGVDVDFPVVFREIAGLDSCIQAGGRCNREGKLNVDESIVYIYDLDKQMNNIPSFIRLPMGITQGIMKEYADISGLDAIKSYFDSRHYFKGDGLDKNNILFETGKFNFKTVAEKFKLIQENTKAIFIDRTEESHNLLGKLRQGIRNRVLMRKVGQYVVGVYDKQFQQLLNLGKIEILDEDLYLLVDNSVYSDKIGLVVDMGEGIGMFF